MSFANAPVTKALILTTAIASVVAGAFNLRHLLNVPLSPHLTRDYQFWRLLTSQCAWQDSTSLFLGSMLLYNVATAIERAFGSLKFASFLFLSVALSAMLELIALLSLQRLSVKLLPAGPFALCFAVLFQYYRMIPSVYQFQVLGLTLSSKSFNYFFAVQLLTSHLPLSVPPALIGLLSGLAYRSELFNCSAYRLPASVVRFGALLRPAVGSTQTHRRSTRTTLDDIEPSSTGLSSSLETGMSAFRNRASATATTSTTPTAPPGALRQWTQALSGSTVPRPEPVSPQASSNLQAMFPNATPEQIQTALRIANSDPSRAAESLLNL